RLVEPYLALFDQLHDERGGERLRDRSDPIARVGGGRRASRDLGQPAGGDDHRPSVVAESKRHRGGPPHRRLVPDPARRDLGRVGDLLPGQLHETGGAGTVSHSNDVVSSTAEPVSAERYVLSTMSITWRAWCAVTGDGVPSRTQSTNCMMSSKTCASGISR